MWEFFVTVLTERFNLFPYPYDYRLSCVAHGSRDNHPTAANLCTVHGSLFTIHEGMSRTKNSKLKKKCINLFCHLLGLLLLCQVEVTTTSVWLSEEKMKNDRKSQKMMKYLENRLGISFRSNFYTVERRTRKESLHVSIHFTHPFLFCCFFLLLSVSTFLYFQFGAEIQKKYKKKEKRLKYSKIKCIHSFFLVQHSYTFHFLLHKAQPFSLASLESHKMDVIQTSWEWKKKENIFGHLGF